jgi:hypothetical protein
MLNWLIKRLSPVKRDTPRWCDLAASLEEFWDEQFTPSFENTANLRSIYTADEAGQLRKISEFGTYYEQDMPAENRPVYFGMRKLEMLQKDTDAPVRMMMQRMGLSDVEWLPLYALSDDLYGARFYTEKDLVTLGITSPGQDSPDVRRLDGSWKVGTVTPIVLKRAGSYLTSRARLGVNLTDFTNTSIIPLLKERIRRIKPLHIVFDGMRYWIYFDITVKASTSYSLYLLKSFNQTYPGNTRVDGSWKIGTDIVHPHKQLTGQWKLDGETRLGAYATPGTVHATLVERKISTSVDLTKTIERPDTYLTARLGESLLRLDGLWNLGGNRILTLAGRHSMVKSLEISALPVSEIVHSWGSEILYPGSPARLVPQITLDGFRQVDGTWKLGTTSIPAKRLNGTWKLITPGFTAFGSGAHTLSGSSYMINNRLDGTPLNSLWKIGGDRKVLIFSAKEISKKTELDISVQNVVSSAWEKAISIQYPSNNTQLARLTTLDGFKRLDGSWKLGEAAFLAAKKLSNSNPWKLRVAGVQCDTAASVTMAGTIGMLPKRLIAGSTKFESRGLKLNGRWHIGAKHKLDSTWKLKAGVTLSAPKITDQQADSGWELTSVPSKLGTGWKLGSSYGPACEAWIDIRKAA